MRVSLSDRDLSELKVDLAVCFAEEGADAPAGVKHRGLRAELSKQMKLDGFKASLGEYLLWNANRDFPARRFMVVGLGKPSKVAGESLRMACAHAARRAAKVPAVRIGLRLPGATAARAAVELRAAVEGARMGAYRFYRHLTDPARRDVEIGRIEVAVSRVNAAQREAFRRGQVAADAVMLARDLVNEAPSRMTPRALASAARREAKRAGITVKVHGPAQLDKLGMHALLSVARGSDQPAQVAHLIYKPKGKPRGRVVLVGKGVTFDSGGLNLKPGASMLGMKADMSGAAAVLATMTALPRVGCRAEVHALLGLTENMTGGDAYKPGDILDTYAGKTVEVGNTDAEGRLVMCDLLAYAADKLSPDSVVDVATLTGACVVALGPMASGVFSRDDKLADALLDAAAAGGEKVWRLPMYDEYLQFLQKGPADIHNVGGRWGGAITAALFLGEFVPRDLSWAHLDIAGPAFNEKDNTDAPEGGTGAAVRTLIRWLEAR